MADVGLTGELKRVPALESRLYEADRLGLRRAYVAKNVVLSVSSLNIEIVRVNSLKEVIELEMGARNASGK